jgi:hypothetical protein
MTLTPFIKFILIAFVFLVNVMLWIWTGIKIDAFALGLNENVYNIVNVIISGMVTGGSALLAYLGLRAPDISEKKEA